MVKGINANGKRQLKKGNRKLGNCKIWHRRIGHFENWATKKCGIGKGNIYTVSQNVSTFKLSATLSNVNRFLKFLHYWKAYKICYKFV